MFAIWKKLRMYRRRAGFAAIYINIRFIFTEGNSIGVDGNLKQVMEENQQQRLRAGLFYLKSKKRDYDRQSALGNRAEKSLMCYLVRQMIRDFELFQYDADIGYKSLDIDFFIDFAEGILGGSSSSGLPCNGG
ncbi:MAG: hypothetical protein EOO20_10395 [Chryseobacterium sp.]|nr:MAG: hypothetical protein EOO20_10395 [Chryseobacterium sp.]